MSINQPRRIFRSGFPRLEAKGLVVLFGVGLMAAAGVSLAMLPRHDAVPAPPSEELQARPAQVAVVDGATLRLRDRVVLLQGVDPPPRGTICGPHDGPGEDCAAAATNALAALVRDAPVVCRITGADNVGRPYAICQASGTELNRAVIAAGWGHADQANPALQQAEGTARAGRRGVWASVRW
ncbi:MAG TPA: thermonuclease family protein [Acetobacteraceae bacterium]